MNKLVSVVMNAPDSASKGDETEIPISTFDMRKTLPQTLLVERESAGPA
ncbi:MAG: hypothetical protein LAD29_00080 [Rhodoferax sp.]|nr:hypothetical protein [Rhodoferax sp.]